MNGRRMVLASLAAFFSYFVLGGLLFTLPGMKAEFSRFPAVYRSAADLKSVFPLGMAAMLVAMVVLVALYARGCQSWGRFEGARFGALLGIFSVCAFVVHNYVNLNIDRRLTLAQAAAYFLEWLVVGVVIGAVYKPLPAVR